MFNNGGIVPGSCSDSFLGSTLGSETVIHSGIPYLPNVNTGSSININLDEIEVDTTRMECMVRHWVKYEEALDSDEYNRLSEAPLEELPLYINTPFEPLVRKRLLKL
jgi:hypothetical protein